MEVHVARKKLWGGRFSSDEDPLFAQFNDSLPFDRELLEADIEGSLAYARALERAGIFTPAERARVEKGLRAVRKDAERDPEAVLRSGAEDVHSYVEQALHAHAGALALKLHTGRSRNDQVATDLRLYLKRKEAGIARELDLLLGSVADLAARYPQAVTPGYTHLQRAQPVLFSHHVLAYGEMFLRDRDRLRDSLRRIDVSPLGSGALSGTVYPVDRGALAADLGFASAAPNSMDAVSDRDFVLDFLFFAAALMVHLSRLAEDLILYNSSEFAFVEMDDSVSSGSSLMPQKKNPDALELVRGKTGRVFGHLAAMLTVLKGLPMTYNKDLQEDKEGVFDTVRTVDACVRMVRRVLEKIRLRPERMREAAARGYLNATELADYLVAKGLPFREAHDLVGKIVMRASELGLPLEQLPLREYQAFSPLFEEGVHEALGLERTISRREEPGGTAPAAVRKALAAFRKRIRS
ncbi:MAG: argininosuccinate lyase [Acidobacteria bacterium]|nr:argininosuccinate lyase [Acidobacteriota bacterium]